MLLFGIPSHKDSAATGAYDPEGVVQMAVRAIKDEVPDLVVITDVCLCEYMDHGHCGVVQDGEIVNDVTLELLAKMAVSHAEAGADIVAPSDMMDGRVAAIRGALDDEGFTDTVIMAYSAKFASAFYGPFRDAAEIAADVRRPQDLPDGPGQRRRGRARGAARHRGGRRHRHGQAGAALPRRRSTMVKQETKFPLAAYNVSGEYAMIKAAAANGWLDERACVMEALHRIKRAGADLIITYHAKDAVRWLQQEL